MSENLKNTYQIGDVIVVDDRNGKRASTITVLKKVSVEVEHVQYLNTIEYCVGGSYYYKAIRHAKNSEVEEYERRLSSRGHRET